MPSQATDMSPAAGIVFTIIWILAMGGMIVGYVIMLIAWWRAMRAHEKIADKLSAILDKLQLK
jgi:uncharacterized membrane protein (DUF485 family)